MDNTSGSSASAFDFDGDGTAELVYNDEEFLRIYLGRDGTVLWEHRSGSSTGSDLSPIVDVDGDGNAEIIKASNWRFPTGLHVYGDFKDHWLPTRQLWNQHTYHITNISEDGSIPRVESPSWLTQNTYRANTRTTGPVLAAPDLTASYVRLAQGTSTSTLMVRIGNSGRLIAPANISVAIYDDDPRAGGRLLGVTQTTQPLTPGHFEDVSATLSTDTAQTLWVAADDDGTQSGAHNECREDNNLHDSGLQIITNQPPVAEAGGPYSGVEGVDLFLDGTASSDPDGDPLSYAWDVNGDGFFDDSTAANPQVRFLDEGTFTVALEVSDGTETATDTATVTITNANPVVHAGADLTVAEGNLISLDGASFTDTRLDTHTAIVNWGDGTTTPATVTSADGTGTITASHTYADNGTFTVTVTVTDNDGGVGADTLTVTVSNVAPVVAAIADQTVADGSEFVLSATFSDPGADTQTVVIDWGDSNSDTQIIGPAAGGEITALHTYADDGVFMVTVMVTDESGGTDTQTFTVTIDNVVPVAEAGADLNATEGQPVSYAGSFIDPGTDTHSIHWDFGDGTVVTNTLTPSHVYTQDGVFTVTLTITDDDGAVGHNTLVVTVANATPVVDAGPDQIVLEGSTVAFTTGTFSDTGILDVHSASIDWGDGTVNAGSVSEEDGSGTVSASHAYTSEGIYTVTLEVTDESGATGRDTLVIEVSNAPPMAEAGADQNVSEGLPVHFTAVVSDPGADPILVSWDFGDGSPVSPSLTPTHIFAQDGTYTVTLTATDDEGDSSTDTLTVTVVNVPAQVDAGPDQSRLEGQSVSLTATFSDQGERDEHTATIDWGDGSIERVPVSESSGQGTLSGSHTYIDDGVFAVLVTIIDDDGGVGTDTKIITVGNVAPVVASGPDQNSLEGGEVTLSSSFTDPGAVDTHSVSWDFGDGNAPANGLNPSHVYAQDGIYTATVTVTDNDGAVGTANTVVTVGNVSPSATAGADQTRVEGEEVSLESAQYTDPGVLDTHTATVDWGDGTITPATITADNFLNAAHTYADNGHFTVTVTVTDETGTSGTDSFSVTVVNAAPVANAGGDQNTTEGATVSFAGSFLDAGAVDTHQVSWNFGDGTTSTGTLNPDHVYVQDGAYTVALTVTDNDGGTDTSTLSVVVENLSPVVSAAANQTVQVNDGVSLSGTTFTDVGVDDVHTATVDWGDGLTETATVMQQRGGGTVEGEHVYTQAGIFQVLISVLDEAQGIGSATLTVTVEETSEPPKKKKKMKKKKNKKKNKKKSKSKKHKSKKSKSKKSKKKSVNTVGH